MPREIITVSVGQAGNQIGWRFWDMVLREHSMLSPPGIYDEGMSTFFQNVEAKGEEGTVPVGSGSFSRGKWAYGRQPLKSLRARAVLVDMEEGVVNQVLRSSIGHLFDKSQLITDVSGAGNNWAHGYCVYGPEYGGAILEQIRRTLEECDSPQSFFMLNSTGGGTGSGVGSYLLEHLADAYPDMYRFVSSVFPSEDDDVVTSPYNFFLSCNKMIEHADCILPLENQALLDISTEVDAGITKSSRGASSSAIQTMYKSALTAADWTGAIREVTPRATPEPAHDEALAADATAALSMADEVLNKALHVARQQPRPGIAPKPSVRATNSTAARTSTVRRPSGEPQAAAISRTARPVVTKSERVIGGSSSSVVGGSSGSVVVGSVEPYGSGSAVVTADKTVKRTGTAFDSMNNIAAHLLTNLTASMRFEGSLNVDLNEITSTLVPFPKLNFLQSSVSPLFMHPEASSMSSTRYVDAMFSEAFTRNHQLLRGDPHKAVHLACGLLLRGDVCISDVNRNVDKLKREIHMAKWNPDGFKIGICGAKPLQRPYSLLALSNNTSVVSTLSAGYDRFMSLYRVRAHIHHYTQYMEADYFKESLTQVMDVISAYNELESNEEIG